MAETLKIDFTNPKTIKKSYNLKNYDTVIIVTDGSDKGDLTEADFLNGIDKAIASGTTFSITAKGKTIKFKNYADDTIIQAYAIENQQTYYNHSLQYFYDNFDDDYKWLSKPSNTKITGTSFSDIINAAAEYVPTAKNQKNKKGVTINAGAGNDTITGTEYKDAINGGVGNDSIIGGAGNDTMTGGAGNDTFVFSKTCGVDTIKDATKDDIIKISDNTITSADLTYRKNGNNLEILFDNDNKFVIQNHFKKAEADRVDSLVINNNPAINISDQGLAYTAKGKFAGTDKNDTIYSGTSNDNITAKGGSDTIVFTGNFGKDTINLTEGERLVLDLSGYEDLDESHIKYSFNKGNLLITPSGNNKKAYGTITIKDFGKSDVTGGTINSGIQAGVFLKLSDKIIDLRNMEYDAYVTSSYTGGWQNDNIYATSANKAVTLTGGKGNDKLYSGAKKATTFVFSEGDGTDKIYDTKTSDIIQIDTKNVSYKKEGGNLVISYGQTDTITVSNYFGSEYRVDKIKYRDENGKYVTKSIKTDSNLGDEILKAKNVKQFDGKVVIDKTSDIDTINFTIHGTFSYGAGNNPENGETADDLIIHYDAFNNNWDDYVVIKGYISGESNVKNMVAWNGYEKNVYEIPYHIGTDGNDEFNSIELNDEYYYLKGGNDTINFRGDFGSENTVYSTGTKATATDTIVLSDFSFEDGELLFGRESGPGGALEIIRNSEEYGQGRILYKNYFTQDSPEVNIVDKNNKLKLLSTYDSTSMNWLDETEADKNHVLFVNYKNNTATTTTIISNTKSNLIEVDSDNTQDTSPALNYTYKGGKDIIQSFGYNSADFYNVDTFTATSALSVMDNGNMDTVNLNASVNDFYMLFNVSRIDLDATVDSFHTTLVHKDALTLANKDAIIDYFATYELDDVTIPGMLRFNGAGWDDPENKGWDTDDYGSTIEYIKTADDSYTERLDIAKWKAYIAGRVEYWLENNESTSGKNLAFYYYSPRGVMEAVKRGEIELTNAQYQSLIDCYKVKYTEIPTDKNMEATTGNDNFELGKANNTITITNPTLGKDTITSTADMPNPQKTDKIIFEAEAGYSFGNGTLTADVSENNLIIGKTGDLANNSITYTNFATDTNRNKLIVEDSSGKEYGMHVTTSGVWFDEGSNNVAFVNVTGSYTSVGSSSGTNYIYCKGEYNNDGHIGGVYYTYNKGTDKFISSSETASDIYSIWKFDENSALSVIDNGGADDYMELGSQYNSYMDDVRLVFDVNNTGVIDYSEFKLVHQNKFSADTLKSAATSDLVAGVLKFQMATEGNSFGIETVAHDFEWNESGIGGDYSYASLNTWADQIVANVQGWLNNGVLNTAGYTSAYQAFNNAGSIDISGLVQAYNVQFNNDWNVVG